MNGLPLVWRFGTGVLALFLLVLPPTLRAEDTAGKLSKAKEKFDTDKDGILSPEEKARAKEDATAQAKAKEAEKLKELLAKYDANGNGQLDESEKARMKADEAARVQKFKQALAKYDVNHNGQLDPDELAKMKEDEALAAKTERQAGRGEVRLDKMRRAQTKASKH